ncbi:hypothetical protein [Deinococcus depolymerans]|uniref:Uncharacterized protein n=1 Tax=Deinococcus depolymerans TaxID=392408 RepID=A0ABN1CA66_9DEIO
MKKTLMTVTAALALTFTAGSAFAAPFTAYATDGNGQQYVGLYTESSWMAIEVPLADLGYTVPSDLSIDAAGLSDGTTITLDRVDRQGEYALLYVTVERADTGVNVNDLAQITVKSGDRALTTVSIPVFGASQ